MSEIEYHLLALIPKDSDFTLEKAVAFFDRRKFGKSRLRSELATGPRKRKPSGFRVFYGDWAVLAWLETHRSVIIESREMAETEDLPGSAEAIAACRHRLSVWSDADPGFFKTNEFLIYTEDLWERFGVFIRDTAHGRWWT
jgi:hypothetical protein